MDRFSGSSPRGNHYPPPDRTASNGAISMNPNTLLIAIAAIATVGIVVGLLFVGAGITVRIVALKLSRRIPVLQYAGFAGDHLFSDPRSPPTRWRARG